MYFFRKKLMFVARAILSTLNSDSRNTFMALVSIKPSPKLFRFVHSILFDHVVFFLLPHTLPKESSFGSI
jgi:hypothetical protein